MPEADSKTTLADIWRLSWPLVMSMFFLFTVGLADVYVAGRFQPEVQGAVGFAGQLLFFFGVVANSLSIGLVAIISRRQGSGDREGVWRTARQGILLAILFAAPLSILGLVLTPWPVLLSFLPDGVVQSASQLLPFYAMALLPQAIITVAGAIFRARTHTLLILLCSGGASIANVIGDFVLSFGYGWIPPLGPLGIGVATAASSMGGGILALAILVKQGMGTKGWRLESPLLQRLIKISWPAGMLQMGWHLGSLALYAILGRLSVGAVAATAALTNGLRIEAILYLPVFALNMVTAVLVGQALGSGDGEAAEKTGWQVAKTAAFILTIVAIPVFIYSREIAGLISPDLNVREMTHLYLRFNMLSQPFMALGVCLGGGLEGAGDTIGTMKVVLGAHWGFRIPAATFLALGTPLAANGVWIAMVLSIILQCGIMVHRYQQGKWKHIKVIAEPGLR